MAQVKKAHVREAILKSADRLFKRKGYVSATTAQIAKGASVSESNLYVYFGSKFSIFMTLYEPWLRARVHALEGRIENETDSRRRLKLILNALWREIPSADNGFTNNLMQALSTVTRREGYRPHLLRWVEGRIESLIMASVPPARRAELGAARPHPRADDGAGRLCSELSSDAVRHWPQEANRSGLRLDYRGLKEARAASRQNRGRLSIDMVCG